MASCDGVFETTLLLLHGWVNGVELMTETKRTRSLEGAQGTSGSLLPVGQWTRNDGPLS